MKGTVERERKTLIRNAWRLMYVGWMRALEQQGGKELQRKRCYEGTIIFKFMSLIYIDPPCYNSNYKNIPNSDERKEACNITIHVTTSGLLTFLRRKTKGTLRK